MQNPSWIQSNCMINIAGKTKRPVELNDLFIFLFLCSCSNGSAEKDEVLPKPRFYLDLWLRFTLQNWILDVGKPITMVKG